MAEPSTIPAYLRGLNREEKIKLIQSALKEFNKWPLHQVPENWQDQWQDHLSNLSQILANYNDQTFTAVINFWTLIDTLKNSTALFLQSIRSSVFTLISNLRTIDLPGQITVNSYASISQRDINTTEPPCYCD